MRGKHVVIYSMTAAVLIFFAAEADKAMYAVKSALTVCAQTVIPALFPFFVISSFMVNTGFVGGMGKLAAPAAKCLFKISGSGAVVFVMGILCGYPTGAKMVSELYENRQISKNEAVRLLPFCNNSGPLFVIGAVGTGMLGSVELGVALYAVHVLSAVLTGIFMSFFSKRSIEYHNTVFISVNPGKAFSDAVCRAVQTMLNVCGFVVFFAVVRQFLSQLIFKMLGTGVLGLALSGMAEVTLGAADICSCGLKLPTTMILLSGVLGFGGICVLLQVYGIVSHTGLGMKTYVLGKLFQMILSMTIMACVSGVYETQTVFADISKLTRSYIDVAPYILIAFFFASAYAAAIKKR